MACSGTHAFISDNRAVVLIDEIDKADIEFPNDLLLELDRMEFSVYETGESVVARHRPVVMITSNNEKELPDAFLRRCFFHYIRFPDRETMRRIVEVHHPGLRDELVREALEAFFELATCRADHVRSVEELFSAARSEFKHLEYYYFHNCLYEWVWRDNRRRFEQRIPTLEVMRTFPPDYKVVFVGDATMSPTS